MAAAGILLEAAFTSAYFNVEVNLKTLGDKKLTKAVIKELRQKEKTIKRIRLQTEERVGKIIRGQADRRAD